MAIDEVLLAAGPGPVLRIYQWARPAVSFGYFEPWEPVRDAYPGLELVRRWTGGGIVPHGQDLTYSLLIPRGGEIALPAPGESYCLIHGALTAAMREAGIDARTTSGDERTTSRACFENPVAGDVMVAGQKIAGAAQRRAKAGFLHQGSIQGQGITLPENFPALFAQHLAAEVISQQFNVISEAQHLVEKKYGTREWLETRGRRLA